MNGFSVVVVVVTGFVVGVTPVVVIGAVPVVGVASVVVGVVSVSVVLFSFGVHAANDNNARPVPIPNNKFFFIIISFFL